MKRCVQSQSIRCMNPSEKILSIGTKIEREFYKNGVVRSTKVIDFDLDTK